MIIAPARISAGSGSTAAAICSATGGSACANIGDAAQRARATKRAARARMNELVGNLREDAFARDIVRRTANAFGGLDFVWDHVGHPGPARSRASTWPISRSQSTSTCAPSW
jgi:hypothetical protein